MGSSVYGKGFFDGQVKGLAQGRIEGALGLTALGVIAVGARFSVHKYQQLKQREQEVTSSAEGDPLKSQPVAPESEAVIAEGTESTEN